MESVVAGVLLDAVEEEEGSPLLSSSSLAFLAASSSSARRSDTISGVRELGFSQLLTSDYTETSLIQTPMGL